MVPFEELPDCFPKWLHQFIFLPAMYEGSSFHFILSLLTQTHTIPLKTLYVCLETVHNSLHQTKATPKTLFAIALLYFGFPCETTMRQ